MTTRLSDLIVEQGPYVAGQTNPARDATAAQMNELRDELIAARPLRPTPRRPDVTMTADLRDQVLDTDWIADQ